MTKNTEEKVLTKWGAISIACDAARFCGIPQSQIEIFREVMDTKVDTFLNGPIAENHIKQEKVL